MKKKVLSFCGLLSILMFVSCNSAKPTVQAQSTPDNKPVASLIEALEASANIQVAPAPGPNGGAYIVTDHGAWYAREGYAVKVKEIEKMGMSTKDIEEMFKK